MSTDTSEECIIILGSYCHIRRFGQCIMYSSPRVLWKIFPGEPSNMAYPTVRRVVLEDKCIFAKQGHVKVSVINAKRIMEL